MTEQTTSPKRKKRGRRATVYVDASGKRWRYKVVAGNNRTDDASEQSFSRASTAVKRIQKRWPDATIRVKPKDDPGPD